MFYHLIVCRSLTHAQKTASALEKAGIPGRVLRTPKGVSEEGCSHSVRVLQRDFPRALERLKEVGLMPKRVFVTVEEGKYQEVFL